MHVPNVEVYDVNGEKKAVSFFVQLCADLSYGCYVVETRTWEVTWFTFYRSDSRTFAVVDPDSQESITNV